MAGISSICPGLVLDRLSSRHWHAVAAHPGHILWAGGLSLVQFRVRQNVDCLKINVSWLFRNKYELCNVPLKFFLYPSFPFSGRTISITFSLFMMRLGIITMVLLFSFTINMKMMNDLQFGLFLTGCVWVTGFLVIIYSLDTVFNSSYGSCNPLSFLGCRQDTFLPIIDTYVQL